MLLCLRFFFPSSLCIYNFPSSVCLQGSLLIDLFGSRQLVVFILKAMVYSRVETLMEIEHLRFVVWIQLGGNGKLLIVILGKGY